MDEPDLQALRVSMFGVILQTYGIDPSSDRAATLHSLLISDADDDILRRGGHHHTPRALLPPVPDVIHLHGPPPRLPAPPPKKPTSLGRLPHDVIKEILSFEFVPRMWIHEWYLISKKFAFYVSSKITTYRQWLGEIHRMEATNRKQLLKTTVNDAPRIVLPIPRNFNLSVGVMMCMQCSYKGLLEVCDGTVQSVCIKCRDLRCCELETLLWTAK
eukprot:PhF_6_TR3321/c0_g1_i2/m.4687